MHAYMWHYFSLLSRVYNKVLHW